MMEQSSTTGSEPEKMGIVSRFFAAFTSPGRLFQHLAQRPVWFWMASLTGLLAGALNLLVFSTEAGASAFRQQLLESGQDLTPEAMERALLITRFASPIEAVVVAPIFCLVLTGIVYLIFNVVLGGEGSFRQALAICSHVFPIGILQGILRSILVIQKGSFQATTSIAAFAPFLESESSILLLLKGIDPFWIWQTALLAMGMSIIHRLPFGKCAVSLFTIYAAILLAVVLISQLFV